MATWKEIANAAETGHFNEGFFHFTMSAEQNADDTIAEGNATKEDFDRIAFATLSDILSDSKDTAAHAFFAALGVKW